MGLGYMIANNAHNKRMAQLLDLAKRARRLSRTITDERTTKILSRAADDFEGQARDLQGHWGSSPVVKHRTRSP